MKGRIRFKLIIVTMIFLIIVGNPINNDSQEAKMEDVQLMDTVQKYYYNQLTDREKQMYKILASSKQQILKNEDIYLGKIYQDESRDEIKRMANRVKWAYRLDNPIETIWSSNCKVCISRESLDIIVTPRQDNGYYEFTSQEQLLKAIRMVESKTKKFVQNLKGTDEQKLKKIQEWLIKDLEYDETLEQSNNDDIFGCIIRKEAICSGYTYAFKYVADMAQLPTISVIGTTEKEPEKEVTHAWNIVFLEGKYYVIDLAREPKKEDDEFYTLDFYYPWEIFNSPR